MILLYEGSPETAMWTLFSNFYTWPGRWPCWEFIRPQLICCICYIGIGNDTQWQPCILQRRYHGTLQEQNLNLPSLCHVQTKITPSLAYTFFTLPHPGPGVKPWFLRCSKPGNSYQVIQVLLANTDTVQKSKNVSSTAWSEWMTEARSVSRDGPAVQLRCSCGPLQADIEARRTPKAHITYQTSHDNYGQLCMMYIHIIIYYMIIYIYTLYDYIYI